MTVDAFKVIKMDFTVEALVKPGEDPNEVFKRIRSRYFENSNLSHLDVVSFGCPTSYKDREATLEDLSSVGIGGQLDDDEEGDVKHYSNLTHEKS
jgi:hypothetical protein